MELRNYHIMYSISKFGSQPSPFRGLPGAIDVSGVLSTFKDAHWSVSKDTWMLCCCLYAPLGPAHRLIVINAASPFHVENLLGGMWLARTPQPGMDARGPV